MEKHLNEMKQFESLIKRNPSDLKKLEESNVMSIIIEYRPKVEELRKIPAKVHITMPIFYPKSFYTEQVY